MSVAQLTIGKDLYMSKRVARKRHSGSGFVNTGMTLGHISPRTPNQESVFHYFGVSDETHLVLRGMAGTGKTLLALYLALREVERGTYSRVVVIRSCVPTRNIGFLPGSAAEKHSVYENPYREKVDELFGRGDAYDILTQKGILEFTSTSYLRGQTLRNAIVIVDEMQNMTFQELDTIATRMGENTRVFWCGDYDQTDLITDRDRSGLGGFLEILESLPSVSCVDFQIDDVIRSGFVRTYLIAKHRHRNQL